jgi:hypothetical protein
MNSPNQRSIPTAYANKTENSRDARVWVSTEGLHGFVRGVAAARAIRARETTLSKLVGELGVLGPQHFKLRERVAAFVPHMQRCGMQGKPACMHNRDGPIRGMEQKDGALSSPPIAPAIALAAIIAAEPMPIEILKADV